MKAILETRCGCTRMINITSLLYEIRVPFRREGSMQTLGSHRQSSMLYYKEVP